MKQRDIRVRAVLRDPPDLKQLARALVQLAVELGEAEAARKTPAKKRKASGRSSSFDSS